MTAAEAAGWVGTALVLGGYWLSIRRAAARWLHLGNAVGCLGTGWSAVAVGAWPNLALTATFGALGWWGLWRDRRPEAAA